MLQTRWRSRAGATRFAGLSLLAASTLLAAACQISTPAGAPTQPAAKPTTAPATQPAAKAESPPTVAAPKTDAPAAPAQVSGTVRSVEGSRVSLVEGGVFDLASDTRVSRTVGAIPSDLAPGSIVAITAQLQPDATLLASMVRILSAAPGASFFGQFPMKSGDLMTNATVVAADPAQPGAFTVNFPGGDASVRLAPDAQLSKIQTAEIAEIAPGVSLMATVANGTARSVSLRS